MIANNYVRHPEQMQHQRELWSKSRRDTIIMRLAGLIMRGDQAPAWWREQRERAKQLAKCVRSACRDWIEEATAIELEARAKQAGGFTAHAYRWNAQVRQERQLRAAAYVSAWLGFGRSRAAQKRRASRQASSRS